MQIEWHACGRRWKLSKVPKGTFLLYSGAGCEPRHVGIGGCSFSHGASGNGPTYCYTTVKHHNLLIKSSLPLWSLLVKEQANRRNMQSNFNVIGRWSHTDISKLWTFTYWRDDQFQKKSKHNSKLLTDCGQHMLSRDPGSHITVWLATMSSCNRITIFVNLGLSRHFEIVTNIRPWIKSHRYWRML